MKSVPSSDWLERNVAELRELMHRRLEAASLESDARREIETALKELDAMWDELHGQAALLVRENERYAAFFEHAPDAYLVTDAGGGVREANRAALELLGLERAAVVGRAVSELVSVEGRARFSARAIPLTESRIGALAWLIRPVP